MGGEPKERFSSFGLVQFVAAVHIFSYHSWQQLRCPRAWTYTGWGPSWVPFFFVLSGFKLSYTQLKRKDPDKLGPLVPFLWRRLVRIYPQYYLSLFMTLLLSLVTGTRHPLWISLPFNLTLTFTWIGSCAGGWHSGWHGTHWYMGDLIVHQICWRWTFPVVYRLSELSSFVLFLVSVLVTGLRAVLITMNIEDRFANFWFPYTANQFLAGVCLAKLQIHRERASIGPRDYLAITVRGCRIPLSALLTYGLVLAAFNIPTSWVGTMSSPLLVWMGILLPLHVLLVWCLCLEEGPLDWLCQRRPFCWLGELSYGVYLFHWNTLMIVKSYGLPQVFPTTWAGTFWFALLPATTLLAALVAVIFDRPTQAWAAGFLRRSQATALHEKTK